MAGFEVQWFTGEDQLYYFRVRDAGNHENLSGSEGYVRMDDMLDTASRFGDVHAEDGSLAREASVAAEPTQDQLDDMAREVADRDEVIAVYREKITRWADGDAMAEAELRQEAEEMATQTPE